EGFPAEGKALMPDDGPPEHAARLLRDLQALVVGEGTVGTWPARRALAIAKPTEGSDKCMPAPGVALLVPTDKVKSWWDFRELAEDPQEGVAPLDEALRLEEKFRKQLQTRIDPERTAANLRARKALLDLERVCDKLKAQEKAQAQACRDVAALRGPNA